MRRPTALAVLACASLLVDSGAGGRPTAPNLLVSLPSLGTVTWACTEREHRYRLAFRVFEGGGTTKLTLLADGVTVRRRVQPGETAQLPEGGLAQRLVLEQFTGAGTVRATVGVRFLRRPVASHCYRYSPPQLSVDVTPRR